MSAEVELLREAARVMRERAQMAPYVKGRWVVDVAGPAASLAWLGPSHDALTATWRQAAHVEAWSPVVALAVADWLDYAAGVLEHLEQRGHKPTEDGYTSRALAVARAYLGRRP